MPLQQILPTWLAINACNDTSPSGITSLRTLDPVFAGGLNQGDYFDTTEQEAMNASYQVNGLLHAGRYRRVQVDPNAVAAQVAVGNLGYMPVLLVPELNVVTTAALGVPGGRIVVFLNTVTPGNWCFIQELGIATVNVTAAVAIGAPVIISGITIGTAVQAIAAAGPLMVLLNLPVVQG